MKKYKAILFDFDGVIGKTMEDNYQAWKHAFLRYGIEINKNEYFLLEGLNTKKVVEYFLVDKNEEIVNQIIDLKEAYYLSNNSFSLYKGTEVLINKLNKKGYLLGLVSGGSYTRLSKSLHEKFLNNFDVIITGDNVSNCKPHPESYLNAAKALSVNASDCLVIENAPVGIEAAKEAKMYCVAICSTLDKKYLKKADKIINKITELNKICI